MNEIVVPISISAASLNASGATPITVASFANDGYIRVPRRLELILEAGTAYTITPTGEEYRPTTAESLGDIDSYTALFRGGAFLVLESQDADARNRAFVFIPEYGFLDTATEQTRVVLPLVSGMVFRPGATTFKLRSSAALSGGTGRLRGFLYYDEYPIGAY